MKPTVVAGLLLLLGSAQFLLCTLIAEVLYPNYNVSANAISDLGVGITAALFNLSIILLGLAITANAYILHKQFRNKIFTASLLLSGIGAVGVGIFPETIAIPHAISSMAVFLFGGLSAIESRKATAAPFSYVSILLGTISLAALFCLLTNNHFGLGFGGMERMVVYPLLFWVIAFSGWLFAAKDTKG